MDVIPAIDLRGGQVVRLRQGDYDCQTVYATDPVEVARTFASLGAGWLHVVDLDAAKGGAPVHVQAVRGICQAVGATMRIEFGGGLRDQGALEIMAQAGASRLVVGSGALADWPWFERMVRQTPLGGRIALGLDARGGRLAVQGWTRDTPLKAVEVAARVRSWPLAAIVHTDIARDGMLTGVNIEATAEVIDATDVPVIASGGVAGLDDVRRCREIGCAGVIVGKAYYEGRFDLVEAMRIGREDGMKTEGNRP